MTTWGELQSQVRSAMLNDTLPSNYKYSAQSLLLYCGMALDELCAHTAKEVEVVYSNQTTKTTLPAVSHYKLDTDQQYELTVRPYDDFINTSAVIAVTNGYGEYYARNPNRIISTRGYYTFPDTMLRVNPAPNSDYLVVRYFGYWTHPTTIDSVLEIPKWAESVLLYRIAIHALTSLGIQTADIRQWTAKGNVDQNPLRAQQEWMLTMYHQMLNQHARQQRGLFYVSRE